MPSPQMYPMISVPILKHCTPNPKCLQGTNASRPSLVREWWRVRKKMWIGSQTAREGIEAKENYDSANCKKPKPGDSDRPWVSRMVGIKAGKSKQIKTTARETQRRGRSTELLTWHKKNKRTQKKGKKHKIDIYPFWGDRFLVTCRFQKICLQHFIRLVQDWVRSL